jgi:hypothetical protein
MESKAKFLGHLVHQMLVVFPLGFLATAPVFDLVGLIRGNSFWVSLLILDDRSRPLCRAGCSLVWIDRLARYTTGVLAPSSLDCGTK